MFIRSRWISLFVLAVVVTCVSGNLFAQKQGRSPDVDGRPATKATDAQLAERLAESKVTGLFVSSYKSKRVVGRIAFEGTEDFYTILATDDDRVLVNHGAYSYKDGVLELTYADDLLRSFVEDTETPRYRFKLFRTTKDNIAALQTLDDGAASAGAAGKAHTRVITTIQLTFPESLGGTLQKRVADYFSKPKPSVQYSNKEKTWLFDGRLFLVGKTTAFAMYPSRVDGELITRKGNYAYADGRLTLTFGADREAFDLAGYGENNALMMECDESASKGDSHINDISTVRVADGTDE